MKTEYIKGLFVVFILIILFFFIIMTQSFMKEFKLLLQGGICHIQHLFCSKPGV